MTGKKRRCVVEQIPSLARRWGVAMILALGWHAIWWNGLRVEAGRSRLLATTRTLVQYAPASAGTGEAAFGRDVVSPMSPLLFALPARQGFSGATWNEKIGVRPPVAAPTASARLSKPPVQQPAATPLLWPGESAWRNDVELTLRAFPMKAEQEPVFALPTATGVWAEIETSGSLEGTSLTLSDLPEWPSELRTQTWDMVVFMEVGERGQVRRLLLEQRSPSALFDEQVERVLRSRTFSDAHTGAGRLRIRAAGALGGDTTTERRRP